MTEKEKEDTKHRVKNTQEHSKIDRYLYKRTKMILMKQFQFKTIDSIPSFGLSV